MFLSNQVFKECYAIRILRNNYSYVHGLDSIIQHAKLPYFKTELTLGSIGTLNLHTNLRDLLLAFEELCPLTINSNSFQLEIYKYKPEQLTYNQAQNFYFIGIENCELYKSVHLKSNTIGDLCASL